MEPCGTPCSIFVQSLNSFFIFIFSFRRLKQSFNCYALQRFYQIHKHDVLLSREYGKQSNSTTTKRNHIYEKPSFHCSSFKLGKNTASLHLPTLKINIHDIERITNIKILGVSLDDNLWKKHIKYFENKIAENIGIMYRAKSVLDKELLSALYYSYIVSYLNYANLAN